MAQRDPEDAAMLEAHIIELRRSRLDWRTIGTRVGLSHERCRQIFDKAISKYPSERLDVLRVEESELADEMIGKLRAMVLDETAKYRDRIEGFKALLLWSESKRRLHGADAPIRREVELLDSTFGNAKLHAELNAIESEALAIERARNI